MEVSEFIRMIKDKEMDLHADARGVYREAVVAGEGCRFRDARPRIRAAGRAFFISVAVVRPSLQSAGGEEEAV